MNKSWFFRKRKQEEETIAVLMKELGEREGQWLCQKNEILAQDSTNCPSPQMDARCLTVIGQMGLRQNYKSRTRTVGRVLVAATLMFALLLTVYATDWFASSESSLPKKSTLIWDAESKGSVTDLTICKLPGSSNDMLEQDNHFSRYETPVVPEDYHTVENRRGRYGRLQIWENVDGHRIIVMLNYYDGFLLRLNTNASTSADQTVQTEYVMGLMDGDRGNGLVVQRKGLRVMTILHQSTGCILTLAADDLTAKEMSDLLKEMRPKDNVVFMLPETPQVQNLNTDIGIQYDELATLSVQLNVSQDKVATSTVTMLTYDSDMICKLQMNLQRRGTDGWETIRRWDDSASGFLQTQCDETIESGYFYRATIQVQVYDATGQIVETAELQSMEIAC